MLKYLLLLLPICITGQIFGQSRVNRPELSFEKATETLEMATGWMLNTETGKWIENGNVINDEIDQSYWISHIYQNFNWIQFATFKQKNITNYILLFESKSGEYRFPNIQEDWEEENRTYFFILDSLQYNQIKVVVNSKKQKDFHFTFKKYGYITDRFQILGGEHTYSEQNLLNKISSTLKGEVSTDYCITINSQHVDGKDVVRFRLPENCLIAKKTKDAYFEVELLEFSKLMSL
ncbi:MAG: hypothetical protein ACOVNZ_06575 [Crocinitomicaceae bacterium]|jgi:hypothetical protein